MDIIESEFRKAPDGIYERLTSIYILVCDAPKHLKEIGKPWIGYSVFISSEGMIGSQTEMGIALDRMDDLQDAHFRTGCFRDPIHIVFDSKNPHYYSLLSTWDISLTD